MKRGVVVEPIPKDLAGALSGKSGKLVATARGDEVDGVVAIPVFETMLTFEDVSIGR